MLLFVVGSVKLLPEGVLTTPYLAEIDYVGFIAGRGHSGSGLVADPHITLWLGIMYYFILIVIQVSQVIFREERVLDLIIMGYQNFFRHKYRRIK